MPKDRGYDIFPRTWLARVLLALAFVGGGTLMFGWIALIIFAGDYSYGVYEISCSGSDLPQCLDEQSELRPLSSASCRGFEKRVCLAPLGEVSPELIKHLVGYYRDEYGISITVLTPNPIPDGMADPERGQIDVQDLMDYMASLFPTASRDPDAILIGVTPVDMYDRTSHYRFLFGARDTEVTPRAVVSSARLNPRFFGIDEGEDVAFSRARKLFTKNIGLLYYGLPDSDDPDSPLYNNVLSVADLDEMDEPLTVPPGR
jgi:predicted Zn-dependent protease